MVLLRVGKAKTSTGGLVGGLNFNGAWIGSLKLYFRLMELSGSELSKSPDLTDTYFILAVAIYTESSMNNNNLALQEHNSQRGLAPFHLCLPK